MFSHILGSFSPNFVVNDYVTYLSVATLRKNEYTVEEIVNCYHARAAALRSRFVWSSALEPVWNTTLIHLSKNVPGKVAYFASMDALMKNRLTRTSPEMFLQRILSSAPDEVKAAWEHEVLGKVLPELHFISNTDPNGWERIYDEGPNSCMAGSSKVRQYAHPGNDLALAYITDSNDRVTHRAIVNNATMNYVRVYGRDPGMFVASLQNAGYTQNDYTLEGQMIHLEYEHCIYCNTKLVSGPYFDGLVGGVTILGDYRGTIGGPNAVYYQSEDICCEDGCPNGEDDYDNDDE